MKMDGSGKNDDSEPPKPKRGRPRLGDLDDPRVTLPATVNRNEKIVRDGFWPKVRRFAGKIPFLEDLLAAYFCAVDPATPWRVKAVLLAALAYFVVPMDVIPDFMAIFGFYDDAGIVAAAIKMVADHITPDHRARARDVLDRGDLA